MIKAAKKAICTILNCADIMDEELLSAVVGSKGLMNSWPLTYQSTNPSDLTPLTPNHFLHSQLGGKFAPETVDKVAFNPRKRWCRVQEFVCYFWHSWLREWISSLSGRKLWHSNHAVLKVGDMMIVMSTDTPLGEANSLWPELWNRSLVKITKFELLTSKLEGLCFREQLWNFAHWSISDLFYVKMNVNFNRNNKYYGSWTVTCMFNTDSKEHYQKRTLNQMS